MANSSAPPLVQPAANTAPALKTNELGHTERIDNWWLEPVLAVTALVSFSIYVFWAVMQNEYYEIGPYLSPFYSPNVKEWFPALFAQMPWLSPAYFVLWAPLLFRGTCYYARRVYYRSFFLTPPACATGPSQTVSDIYSGERKFPLVFLNLHRYFFIVAAVLALFHWKHFIDAFFYEQGMGVGVGTLVVFVDALFLTLYVFSCHSWRHLLAGKMDCFTCSHFTENRHAAYKRQSLLNEKHGLYFWISLATVWFADIYIRQVAMGNWTDIIYIFNKGFITL